MFPLVINNITDSANYYRYIQSLLQGIPNHGLSYGILAYLKGYEELICSPAIAFNYLGAFAERVGTDQVFSIEPELPHGDDISRLNHDFTPTSLNCSQVNGYLVGELSSSIFIQTDLEELKRFLERELILVSEQL